MMDTSTFSSLAACSIVLVLVGGQFDNHFWRLLCIYATWKSLFWFSWLTTSQWYVVQWLFPAAVSAAIWFVPHLRPAHKRAGCVVITGADSGMGQQTVLYLAETNDKDANGHYEKIFAAAFNAKQCQEKLEELVSDTTKLKHIQVIPLDVTKDESVHQAAKTVKDYLAENKTFLSGVVNYHGIAYNGPLSYMPLNLYQTQMEVNFFGNVRMCQAFLPILRDTQHASTDFRRLVFTGTGGGPCSPCPPLLSAYMSSKFAGEAMAQSLKQELFMTQGDGPTVDVSVINPGFVKPTMLIADGMKLTEKMWKLCEDQLGSSIAKDTYGKMMDHFNQYAALQPGTHVSQVCKAAEHALTAYKPRSSYKVGIDSKLAPLAGMLPTGAREWVARHGIYGILSPAGTVKGYQV